MRWRLAARTVRLLEASDVAFGVAGHERFQGHGVEDFAIVGPQSQGLLDARLLGLAAIAVQERQLAEIDVSPAFHRAERHGLLGVPQGVFEVLPVLAHGAAQPGRQLFPRAKLGLHRGVAELRQGHRVDRRLLQQVEQPQMALGQIDLGPGVVRLPADDAVERRDALPLSRDGNRRGGAGRLGIWESTAAGAASCAPRASS